MSKLDEILEFNKDFVENKDYEQYITSKILKRRYLSYLVWIQGLQIYCLKH